MTDEEWRQSEEKYEVLKSIAKDYHPPRFDPFIELDPPISLIKQVIKSLKQQAYGEQELSRRLKAEGLPTESTEARAQKVISRIRSYQFRLDRRSRSGSWQDDHHDGTIGDSEIRRAKEVPIESLYDGTLRRVGGTLVGLCPFHTERSGSFTIYLDRNLYYCYGCNARGDSIDYLVARDKVDFITAVKMLQ